MGNYFRRGVSSGVHENSAVSSSAGRSLSEDVFEGRLSRSIVDIPSKRGDTTVPEIPSSSFPADVRLFERLAQRLLDFSFDPSRQGWLSFPPLPEQIPSVLLEPRIPFDSLKSTDPLSIKLSGFASRANRRLLCQRIRLRSSANFIVSIHSGVSSANAANRARWQAEFGSCEIALGEHMVQLAGITPAPAWRQLSGSTRPRWLARSLSGGRNDPGAHRPGLLSRRY